MKISAYTVPELDFFLAECNFTRDEKELFDLRAEDRTLEECAEIMHLSVSSIKRISQHVMWKIERVKRSQCAPFFVDKNR